MALLTKPADFTAAVPSVSALNDAINRLYTELGYTSASGGDDQGDLTDVNIAAAAAVQRTKIADTAVVCGNTVDAGTQTVTRPTVFSGGVTFGGSGSTVGVGESIDLTSANYATIAVSDGATTVAIAAPTKRFHLLTYADGAASDASITTITGGTSGRVYTFAILNADVNNTVLIAHTDTDGANTFKMKGLKSLTSDYSVNKAAANAGSSNEYVVVGTFLFGDLFGRGASQFWEI